MKVEEIALCGSFEATTRILAVKLRHIKIKIFIGTSEKIFVSACTNLILVETTSEWNTERERNYC